MTHHQGLDRCIEQNLDSGTPRNDAEWAKTHGIPLEEFLARVERLKASRLSLAPPNKLDDFGGAK